MKLFLRFYNKDNDGGKILVGFGRCGYVSFGYNLDGGNGMSNFVGEKFEVVFGIVRNLF